MTNQSKRIAFISEHASPLANLGGVDTGGQNVYVAQLAKHLAHQGHTVDIYTRREDTVVKTVVDWLPHIRVIHVKAGPAVIMPKEELLPHMDEFEQHMLQFINAEKLQYDLIHANFFMSALVGLNIKKVTGIPLVVTFHALGHVRRLHQQDEDKFPVERLAIEKKICQEADSIIAECPQDREDLIQYYAADAAKITIVPCGFSQSEFYPINKLLARKILGINPDERIILQLGRMVPRKGIDNVINALSVLKNQGIKDVKLLVVGGNMNDMEDSTCPEYGRLKTLVNTLDIKTQVKFAGKKSREHLKFYYAAADVFITTPWYEPFGITPLEAMACGTPVIGSNVGGIKYSVVDGATGALVPPHNPQALAQKIDELIHDETKLEQYGQNALTHVNHNFTWRKVAVQLNKVYNVIISHGRFTRSNDKERVVAA